MNLEQIAKLSGVSRSTVSRVINNDPNVSVATREKVMQVVKRVNYTPNAAARGLAAGRTHVLGLVIPTGVAALFTDPYFPILIQGVSSACNAREYSVMLWLAEPEYERRQIRQIMYSGLVDGVIVSSMLLNDSLVQALFEGDLRSCWWDVIPPISAPAMSMPTTSAGRVKRSPTCCGWGARGWRRLPAHRI
jgi:LacI family transcriptional regulator